jgi:hypothetical protein
LICHLLPNLAICTTLEVIGGGHGVDRFSEVDCCWADRSRCGWLQRFGRVVDSSPIDDEDVIRDDSGFTVVWLYYDNSAGFAWSIDGELVPSGQVIPRLEERLEELGDERMRVVVIEPKSWSPEPNPILDDVKEWARERRVSLRVEQGVGHVRGVTFGRKLDDA